MELLVLENIQSAIEQGVLVTQVPEQVFPSPFLTGKGATL